MWTGALPFLSLSFSLHHRVPAKQDANLRYARAVNGFNLRPFRNPNFGASWRHLYEGWHKLWPLALSPERR
jgi:hypothetical protein